MKDKLIVGWEMSKGAIARTYQVVKVAGIVAVIATSAIGTYVLLNAELRNVVIDYAQDQQVAEANSPKE